MTSEEHAKFLEKIKKREFYNNATLFVFLFLLSALFLCAVFIAIKRCTNKPDFYAVKTEDGQTLQCGKAEFWHCGVNLYDCGDDWERKCLKNIQVKGMKND